MESELCKVAPVEWQRLSVESVCKRVTSGGTPSRRRPEFYIRGKWGWVKTQELKDGWINQTEEHITDEAIASSSAKLLPSKTVLLALYGATVGQLGILRHEMTCNQACCAMIVDPQKADYQFLFYQLLASRSQLKRLATGAAQQNLSGQLIKSYKLPFPPLKEQQAIACILGALDDKIELNRRMNQTLEAMARAIFKSWFVDFDPVRAKDAVRREHPGWTNEQVSRSACPNLKPEIAALFPDSFEGSELGEIPKGWKVGKFGNCCDVKGGYAYKSKDFADEGYPLVRIKNITPEKTVDLFDVVYIPKEIALQTKNFWLNDGDLLMAMTGATIGKFGLIVNREEMSPAVLNQRVAKIAQKNTQTNKSWFIFVALIVTDVYDQVVNIGGGSAQPNISSSQIENCRFVVPSDAIILSFTNHVDPMMQKWLSNIQEARRLAAIRDALLPKLISGELRVPDAERIVGRAL